MPITTDELYRLLPALYRSRDADRGGELRELVEVLAQAAALLERDIDALYDNWFIESCEEWVVPYLGDLLAARALHPVSAATYSQRARVANTIGYRRRKGTASMLAELARDTTGWAAHVVELFTLLATTQHLVHVRPGNHRTPDLRAVNRVELEGGPFDTIAHTADVRHIDAGRGRYNVMNVGIFLWRLRAFPVREAMAFAHGDGRFSVSPLGQPMALFHAPLHPEPARASEADVPGPIRRRALRASSGVYYGAGRSIAVLREGSSEVEEVVVCDLSDWSHRPPAGKVALDPELGRFAFAPGRDPGVAWVTYHYGFSAELGGGGYSRGDREAATFVVSRSGEHATLGSALNKWRAAGRPSAVVELGDSSAYEEEVVLELPAGCSLVIRAAPFCRPVLRLQTPLRVSGEPGASRAEVALEGLLITGAPVEVMPGDLGRLTLEHTTLVPGLALDARGEPRVRGARSLVVSSTNRDLRVRVVRSIVGALDLAGVAGVELVDSIVDSAVAGGDDVASGHAATVIRASALVCEACTVFGSVTAETVEISNSIFTGPVVAQRKQEGCVRFSFIPAGSIVPRRHRCQPEPSASVVHTAFTATHYGAPGYAQLGAGTSGAIVKGADDQGEMGAFHHLMQPQREANLRASLDEYLRVGLEAGLHYVT